MPKFDINQVVKDNLKGELKNTEIVEVALEPKTIHHRSFQVKAKPIKEKPRYKHNFPLYIQKSHSDRLSAIASDNNMTRNELLLQMINHALESIGEPPVE